MTQDRNVSDRPLFADIDDHDEELARGDSGVRPADGAGPADAPGPEAGPAAIETASLGQPGTGAIPLGPPPTSVSKPPGDADPDELPS